MSGVIFFSHLHPSRKKLYEIALKPLGVKLVQVYQGSRSSTYTKAANDVRTSFGSVVKGLKKVYLRKGEEPDWVGLACYSAGYGLVREALKDKDHGVKLVVSIDSIYAGKDADGTASDKDLAKFVAFAKEAREGNCVFWLGHGDVPVSSYASTTKVANEIRRLAGEPEGGLHIQAFDVAKSEGAEHSLALTQWGPDFMVQAVTALQEQQRPSPPSSGYVY